MRLPRLPQMTGVKTRSGSFFGRPLAVGLTLGSALVCAFAPRAAEAHIRMTAPMGWVTTDGDGDPQKITPCGVDSTVAYTPTNAVTTLHVGDQVTFNWIETIPHDGHFRISLAVNSRSELLDPLVTKMNSDNTASQVAISNPPVYPVLADDLFEHTAATTSPGKTYSYTITIPNMPCAKCTLQLLQFMANHPPDPSYFYHQCADVTILAASTTGTGGSGATGAGGTNAIGTGGTNATGTGGTNATGTGGTNATGTGGTNATGTGGTNATGAGGSGAGGSLTGAGGSAKGSGGSSAGGSGAGGAMGSGGDAATGPPGGPVGGTTSSSGCSCASGGAGPGSTGFALLGLALFVVARGRRARR